MSEFSDLTAAPDADAPAAAPEAPEPDPDLHALGQRAFEGEELERGDESEYEDGDPDVVGADQTEEELSAEQEQALFEAQREALASMSPDELQEWLEDFAVEDPIGFAEWSAAMGAEQARAEYAERLDPVLEQHSEQMASQTVDALKAEFGADVFEANKAKLVEALERDPEYFADPKTRAEKLGIVLRAELYDQRQRYERGEDVREQMGGEERRDAFGRLPYDPGLDEFAGREYPKPQVSVEDEIAAIDKAHARFNSG